MSTHNRFGCTDSLGTNGVDEAFVEAFCEKYDYPMSKLDCQFNFCYCERPRKRRIVTRGGETYHPPFGCYKLALKLELLNQEDAEVECPICLDMVDDPLSKLPCGHMLCKECWDECWDEHIQAGGNAIKAPCPLCRQVIEAEEVVTMFHKAFISGDPSEQWPIAYHGTHSRHVASILFEGLRIREGRDIKHGTEFGKGIYLAPKVRIAERYCSPAKIKGVDFNVIFQVRVKPGSYDRFELNGHEVWVIRDEEHARLTGVILK